MVEKGLVQAGTRNHVKVRWKGVMGWVVYAFRNGKVSFGVLCVGK